MPTKHTHTHTDAPRSFEQMLHTPASQFKEPGRVPSGQWYLQCISATSKENEEYEEGGNKSMGTVTFIHTPLRPGDNVDTSAVEGGDWRGAKIFTYVNINNEPDFVRVRQIVEGHGISAEDREIVDLLELVKQRPTQATVGLRTYKDRSTGETVIKNTLSNFAAA